MSDAFDSRAKEKMGEYRTPVGGPSLGESFVIGVGTEVDEYASYSQRLAMSGAFEGRNSTILEWNKSGALPNGFWQEHRAANPYASDEMKWGSMAFKLKHMGFDIKTDNEIELEIGKTLENRQINYANPIRQRQGAMGTAAEFAGGLTVAATDPLMWPTYFFGVGAASKTLGLTNKLLHAAKAGAVIGAGSQTVLEPFIHDWKEIRGVPYTLNDSLLNIGAAGLLGGTMDGLISGLSHAITRTKSANLKSKDVKDSTEVIEQVRNEMEMAPKDMKPEVALRAVEEEHTYHTTRTTEVPPVPEAIERLNYVQEIPPLPTVESIKGNKPEVKGLPEKKASQEPTLDELKQSGKYDPDFDMDRPNPGETTQAAAVRMQELEDAGYNAYNMESDTFEITHATEQTTSVKELKDLEGTQMEFDYPEDMGGAESAKIAKAEDDKITSALIESMQEKGYVGKPIELAVFPNGEVRIVDGNHRARAAKAAGLETVPTRTDYLAGAETLGEVPAVKESSLPNGLAEADIVLEVGADGGLVTSTIGDAVRADERKLELLDTLKGCISGR